MGNLWAAFSNGTAISFMTNQEINEAIASVVFELVPTDSNIPNYCADLNAMHEAEKIVERIMHERGDDYAYGDRLVEVTQNVRPISATARQRAEAFLRTIGKWKEESK